MTVLFIPTKTLPRNCFKSLLNRMQGSQSSLCLQLDENHLCSGMLYFTKKTHFTLWYFRACALNLWVDVLALLEVLSIWIFLFALHIRQILNFLCKYILCSSLLSITITDIKIHIKGTTIASIKMLSEILPSQ